jgi:hypothetical protein
LCLAAIVVLGLGLSPNRAAAQTDNHLAIGPAFTSRITDSRSTANNLDWGIQVRLGHEEPGWNWAYSLFGWFDLGVRDVTAMPGLNFGDLRLRPFMVGYGYTKVRGHTAITADLVGGYSLNSFDVSREALATYVAQVHGGKIEGHASNGFTLKPEVQIWHDLSERVGIKLDAGYLIARPTLRVSTLIGDESVAVHGDVFLITVGLVYSFF